MVQINWVSDTDILANTKESKKAELSRVCQQTIESGFTVTLEGVDYRFSYDREAQNNLLDGCRLFDNNMVDTYTLTCHTGDTSTRLTLDRDTFNQVYAESVKHKQYTISLLRDTLYPYVESLTGIAEVEAVVWADYAKVTPLPKALEVSLVNMIQPKLTEVDDTLNIILPPDTGGV